METRRKIIIDTDIGDDIDDAFAILLAVLSEKFEILGITTVFRNSLHRGKIVKALLRSVGADIPVYTGADVALAPFTNLANAAEKRPDSFRKIKEILLMGGDGTLNFAEWNVRCDCAAAKIVFDCGADIRVCGFDITSAARLSQEDMKKLRSLRAAPFQMLVRMMDKYINDYHEERIPTMHDPVALCAFLIPDKFLSEEKKLTVSLNGETRGMLCVCGESKEKSVIVKADVEGIIAYMLECFRAYDVAVKKMA